MPELPHVRMHSRVPAARRRSERSPGCPTRIWKDTRPHRARRVERAKGGTGSARDQAGSVATKSARGAEPGVHIRAPRCRIPPRYPPRTWRVVERRASRGKAGLLGNPPLENPIRRALGHRPWIWPERLARLGTARLTSAASRCPSFTESHQNTCQESRSAMRRRYLCLMRVVNDAFQTCSTPTTGNGGGGGDETLRRVSQISLRRTGLWTDTPESYQRTRKLHTPRSNSEELSTSRPPEFGHICPKIGQTSTKLGATNRPRLAEFGRSAPGRCAETLRRGNCECIRGDSWASVQRRVGQRAVSEQYSGVSWRVVAPSVALPRGESDSGS